MPDGEGPLLTAQVFGTGPTTTRFPLQDGKLAAGLLDGLTEGTEVALYATPAGGTPLGISTLTTVNARESNVSALPPPKAQWAELTSAAPPADPRDYSAWTAVLPEPGENPDLTPILTDGTIALAQADGTLDPQGPGSTPRIRVGLGETEAVARFLDQAAHGLALRAVLSGATGRSLTGKARLTATTTRRVAITCDEPGPETPFDPADALAPCDQLWLTLTNTSGTAQDVSVLYFTADFRVQPIWPTQNLSNRLAPGESTRVGLMIEPTSTAGLEEIWTLAVPATPDAPRVDLTRLATTDTTRATPPDPMTAWLTGRMDPETQSRGFTLKPAPLTMLRQIIRLTPGTPAPTED